MPRLLVVDHDRDTLAAFRDAFEGSDVAVLSARSDDEGLESFECHRPEVVILASNGSDGSSLELLQRIRHCEPGTPVIFLAANGTATTAIEAMKVAPRSSISQADRSGRTRDVVDKVLRSPPMLETASRPGPRRTRRTPAGRSRICPAMQEVYKAIGRVAPEDVTC